MSKSYYRSKLAAMVVTVIALSFVLPDSAVAETDTVAKAISSARVRRIARGVANEEINKRAPGLSVGSAVSAQSANTANTASSANPVLFARVAADGTVDPANSKGVGSGNVTAPVAGVYCFSGLPAIMGGQVTPDLTNGLFSEFGQFGFGNALGSCPPATQFFVAILGRDTAGVLSTVAGPFFLHLY
ncbi:MAG: hypothetical protein M3461_10315 [Pseudomonadota bacterium]|nr:hypothetical protein [Pseudomonadota bacterium]